MKIIVKTTLLAGEPPSDGTRIRIKLDDPGSLVFGIYKLILAEGHGTAVVDWGDGTREDVTASGSATHTYARTGEYDVSITDDVSGLQFSVKSSTSPYRTVYAPMIREFRTTATLIDSFPDHAFHGAVNMSVLNYGSPGPQRLGVRALDSCLSLTGRLNFPEAHLLFANTFDGSTGITELHFAAENEAIIRSSPAWAESGGKFGAPNATTFFDL